ncbi:MAG TPA: DinB family protein [Puia sp.]|nr:DinB family protein [Puia sp.]
MPLSSSMASRLNHQHHSIREIVGDLPENALRMRAQPGKWSALENIAHLTAYQPVFIDRLERIDAEQGPVFGRYVAENDPQFQGYLERSLASLLKQLDTDRSRIQTLLETGGEPFLAKTAKHARYGLLSVKDWTEFFLLHESHHLYTIFLLVRDLRANLQ